MAARVGRWAIVGAVGWVIVFGVVGQFRLAGLKGNDSSTRASAGAYAWPGDDAKAFASLFATTLTTYTQKNPEQRVASLKAMVVSTVDPEQMLGTPATGIQQVTGAWPSRPRRIDSHHATITVAISTVASGKPPATMYLSVPVARDDQDGLVVYDYPTIVSPPAAAHPPVIRTGVLELADAEAIAPALDRFLADQYLTGKPIDPVYLVPGVHVVPLGHAYTHVSLDPSLDLVSATASTRTVLAKVQARDAVTGADLTLRYRIRVAYRDQKWLIRSID